VPHLQKINDFIVWVENIESKVSIDDDVAFLMFAFNIEYARRDPAERLSHEDIEVIVDRLIGFVEDSQCMKSVKMLESFAEDYDKAGIPRPLMLRSFNSSKYKSKRGRPKGRTTYEQDLEFARRVYEQRKKEGCFPAKQWNVENLPFNLSDEIEKQIETDAGISNHFERLAKILDIPRCSRALSQAYLGDKTRRLHSLRRFLIIEDMAIYCFKYWISRD
jgi:hypothetical protein